MSRAPDQSQQLDKRTTSEATQRNGRQSEDDPGQGAVDQRADEGSIQDQLILAPEIMQKILEHLDFRSLKKVRLVCKSWLLEAQTHMERRGFVWLGEDCKKATRIKEFMEIRRNKIPALPQPFMSLDVDLDGLKQTAPYELALRQLSTLCPPLVITRLATDCMPLALAVPLILQCSSSLEYLKLFGRDCDEEGIRSLEQNHPNVNFSKLRRLDVETLMARNWNGFPRLLRWVMRASPNVDSFQAWTDAGTSKKLANGVLLVADLWKMTTLKLEWFTMGTAILNHFSSMSFSKLQHLRMQYIFGDAGHQVLLAIVTKAAATLRKLEMLDGKCKAGSEFPVCPNVQELSLKLFPGWSEFVSRCFPSLKNFCVKMPYSDQGLFPSSPSLVAVKTLSFPSVQEYRHGSFGPMEIFTTFPALEHLCIHQSYLIEYHRMKSRGDPEFVDLLKGLRHLELLPGENDTKRCVNYSFFAGLRGIETLAVEELSQVLKIPVEELFSLKSLRFSWEECSNLSINKLLQIARGVEKVEIVNCCSFLRDGSSRSKELLVKFFEAAPNVICGCKQQEGSRTRKYLLDYF